MNAPDINDSGSSLLSQSTFSPPAVRRDPSRRQDLATAGLIFLYCLLFAVLRVSVSSSMELDESEQFLNGSFFSLGYAHQPPLYSWIVHSMSLPFGMGLWTLVMAKYTILFSFYLSFYLIARTFWSARASLLVTGSLLFFPTYSYEFNRDLSHSILVTAMASISCYLFLRLLRQKRTVDYLLFGVSLGLGLLSKYNFLFFLSALVLAAASFHKGRRVLFDKRTLVSLTGCLLTVSPHILWLIQNEFLPFRHALTKAETGGLPLSEPQKVLSVVLSSYSGVIIFLAIFTALFGFRILRTVRRSRPSSSFFGYLVFYGLSLPLFVIVVLRTGHFSERWLAPLLFCVPLAMFSRIEPEPDNTRVKALGYLALIVAVSVFLARSFIGFFPDDAGKVERIHTPFRDISTQLERELGEKGIGDLRGLTIVTDSELLAANIGYCLPGTTIYLADRVRTGGNSGSETKTKVILWDAGRRGENIPDAFARKYPSARPLGVLRAPYLRASRFPPYALGVALIR
jgi:4-amino-4-deoxy-L-arabinose transferase-like glycosyltransferase